MRIFKNFNQVKMAYQFLDVDNLIFAAAGIVIGADCDEFEAGFQIYFYFHL